MNCKKLLTSVFGLSVGDTLQLMPVTPETAETIKTTPCIYCRELLTNEELLTCKCIHCGEAFIIIDGKLREVVTAYTCLSIEHPITIPF